MIRLILNRRIWDAAEARAAGLPVYKGSHRGADANVVGTLGECVFEHWMKARHRPFVYVGSTAFDYRGGSCGVPVEIKTKDRTVMPRPHHAASIPAYNAEHQRPEWYLFVSLLRAGPASAGIERFKAAFLLGACPRRVFHAKAKLWRTGETDPRNGTRFWTDCLNMPIAYLMDLEAAARQWDAA